MRRIGGLDLLRGIAIGLVMLRHAVPGRFAGRLRMPPSAQAAALLLLALLSVVPLREHALTYLAGGPAIAALTAVLLLSWCSWTDVTAPTLRVVVWLGTVSYGAYLWSYPLTLWPRPHLETGAAGLLAAVPA
jgi:peptidoglycan/LPS O-acetylase OafA/YrhL